MYVEQVAPSPSLDGRARAANGDPIFRGSVQLPPELGPVIGLINIFHDPCISGNLSSLHEAQVAAGPVAVMLVRAVDCREIAKGTGSISGEQAMIIGHSPLALGRTAALAIDEDDIVTGLFDVVAAGIDGKIFAQRRQAEMAATVVSVALRAGRTLRAIEYHTGRIRFPTAAKADDPPATIGEVRRQLGPRRSNGVFQFIENEER